MNAAQEQHLERLKTEVGQRMDAKFRAGALEHGGDLRDYAAERLVNEALDECIDALVYLYTVRDKLTMALHCHARTQSENVSTQSGNDHECGSDDGCRVCREAEP